MIAPKGGTGRVIAEEVDSVIGEFIHPLFFTMHRDSNQLKSVSKNKGITTRNYQ